MKTHILPRLAGCLFVSLAASATAGNWEAPYVEEGINRCVGAARALKDMSGFGARSDGICLIGGFMEVGGEITWKCNLQGGKEYIFVASGDTDVKDLDLEAWEDDKKIAQDKLDDNVPIVTLTVEEDCEVTLKMKLEKAPGDGQKHFNVMIMLEKEGTGGKLSQLETVAKQLNAVCSTIADKGKLEFDRAPNAICLAASLLESGASRTFNRNFSSDSTYVMVGAGDDACQDFDLEVSHDDKCIARDEETDSTPVVAIKIAEESARCSVKMTMHESKKASFSVVAILVSK